MSNYTVLYRKYRPETLDDVVGRKYIIQSLQNAIENNMLAHAYLFCGPRGTGKTSLARIFAREINKGGSEEDIIEIDAASNNGVDEIRNLVDRVKFAPISSQYKVYIIDEVHMMTTGAFNAFLKTIEEPPAHVIFILATTEPHKVIETILSRCQRYDFKAFTDEEIITRLEYVADKEGIKTDNGTLKEISKLSNGGLRDALSILDQLSTFTNRNITTQSIEELYGTISYSIKNDLINLVLECDEDSILNRFEVDLKNKNIDYKVLIQDLLEILKNKLVGAEYIKSRSLILKLIDSLVEMLSKLMFIKNNYDYLIVSILKCVFEEKQNKIQNVSRETSTPKTPTIQKVYKPVKKETTDYEFYLKLLVSANKDSKTSYKKCFEDNTSILLDVKNMKYYNLLSNLDIVASNNQFILFNAKTSHQITELKKYEGTAEFNKFLNSFFGKIIKVFMLLDNEVLNLIELFKQRRMENKLPEPIKLEIEVIDVEENSPLDKMKEIFKDKLEIVKGEIQ